MYLVPSVLSWLVNPRCRFESSLLVTFMNCITQQEIRNYANGGLLRYRYVAVRGYGIQLVLYSVPCVGPPLRLHFPVPVCLKVVLYHYLAVTRYFGPKILYTNHG